MIKKTKKRDTLLLIIGKLKIHITMEEADKILLDLISLRSKLVNQ